jgi:hypothetical protein
LAEGHKGTHHALEGGANVELLPIFILFDEVNIMCARKFMGTLGVLGLFLVASACEPAIEESSSIFTDNTGKADNPNVTINDSPYDADSWFDITVLSARVLDKTLKDFDRVESCDKVWDRWEDSYHGYKTHYERFDCSGFIGRSLNATALKPLPEWQFTNGHLTTPMDTPLIEVLTVIPVDRLSQATHVGFSESFMGGRVNYFVANGPEGKTREVQKVTLKDGRIGIVHRWIVAFESNGSSGSGYIRTVPFKPCLVRWNDDHMDRYWDNLIGVGMFTDYIVTNWDSPTYSFKDPTSYDRSSEVLQ